MIGYQATPDYYNDYISHYNHYHDPKNGQFSSSKDGGVKVSRKERVKQIEDEGYSKKRSKKDCFW